MVSWPAVISHLHVSNTFKVYLEFVFFFSMEMVYLFLTHICMDIIHRNPLEAIFYIENHSNGSHYVMII